VLQDSDMNTYSVSFDKKTVLFSDIDNPWRFKTDDKKDYDAKEFLEKTEEKDFFKVYEYRNEENSFSGKRICISDGKNACFIMDFVKSDKDICIYSDFSISNCDLSVSCNVADKSKLVIRTKDCGVKHFRMDSLLDGESVLEKSGLMMPVSISSNGDITYSMYEGLYSFGKEHFLCFGFALETLGEIIYWHLNKTETGYVINHSKTGMGVEIEKDGDILRLFSCSDKKLLAEIKL